MKKKLFIILLTGLLAAGAFSCGSSDTQSGTDDTDLQSGQEETSENENEVTEEDGIRKEVIYTDKELNLAGESGPFQYTIAAIQVSKITALTETAAELLDIEKDKAVTLVSIQASAENTSDNTNSFYIGQAQLTSNTKEQADSDMFFSDYIEGEFLGKVVHEGTLVYILPKTEAEQLNRITLHIDGPCDEDYESIGEDVKIDIKIKK